MIAFQNLEDTKDNTTVDEDDLLLEALTDLFKCFVINDLQEIGRESVEVTKLIS